jgi:hypothetical protein
MCESSPTRGISVNVLATFVRSIQGMVATIGGGGLHGLSCVGGPGGRHRHGSDRVITSSSRDGHHLYLVRRLRVEWRRLMLIDIHATPKYARDR